VEADAGIARPDAAAPRLYPDGGRRAPVVAPGLPRVAGSR
jgi:hypothetical protein